MEPSTRLADGEQWGQARACGWHEQVGASPQWRGLEGRHCKAEVRLRERWSSGNGEGGKTRGMFFPHRVKQREQDVDVTVCKARHGHDPREFWDRLNTQRVPAIVR